MEYTFICFILAVIMLFLIHLNHLLRGSVFELMAEEMQRKSVVVQMKLAESIMKSVRYVHYRDFSDYILSEIDKHGNRCLNSDITICTRTNDVIETNLHLYRLLLKNIFKKTLYSIIKSEIELNHYTYLDDDDFADYVRGVSKKISDYVWHEYENEWLKPSGLSLDMAGKKEYLKQLYEKNNTIEIASLQLFHQTRLIQLSTDKKIKELKKRFFLGIFDFNITKRQK